MGKRQITPYILRAATARGAWLYTPDLRDLAHLPDAYMATISPDGRYIAGVGVVMVWGIAG